MFSENSFKIFMLFIILTVFVEFFDGLEGYLFQAIFIVYEKRIRETLIF